MLWRSEPGAFRAGSAQAGCEPLVQACLDRLAVRAADTEVSRQEEALHHQIADRGVGLAQTKRVVEGSR